MARSMDAGIRMIGSEAVKPTNSVKKLELDARVPIRIYKGLRFIKTVFVGTGITPRVRELDKYEISLSIMIGLTCEELLFF
jgi:acyl dehydratase